MSRFLLGINYWPRRSAMYMWAQFDIDEIAEDMTRIKELGLDVVRFFLTWEAFQPEPNVMNADALRRFDAVMARIDDAGLKAMPTLFCGNMSGVNWLPAWALERATTDAAVGARGGLEDEAHDVPVEDGDARRRRLGSAGLRFRPFRSLRANQ